MSSSDATPTTEPADGCPLPLAQHRGYARRALAIGPANYAGQATAWAAAVRRELQVPSWSFSRTSNFSFPVDRRLSPMAGSKNRRQPITDPAIQSAVQAASHVCLDGFLPLTGGRWSGDFQRDIDELQQCGKWLALACHGSDVRNPVRHLSRVPHSWWRTGGMKYLAQTMRLTATNLRIIRKNNLPVFVSTPDLLHDVPDATWLPLTVNVSAFQNAEPIFSGNRLPRVLHLPTRRKPAIKGTEVISPVLRQLHCEGLIEAVEPAQMPHEDFIETLKGVDIVIDQIRCDSYGATSVEAMAAGRLTLSSVLGTRDLIGLDVPIIDATPTTVEPILRRVLRAPERFRDVAESGPSYARRVHDGRAAALVLRQFMTNVEQENIGSIL